MANISTSSGPWLGYVTLADSSGNSYLPFQAGNQLTASSGNVANATAIATLAGVSGKTTYISGFIVSGTGATVGLPVIVTVTGTISGTLHFIYSASVGVLLINNPLIVSFPMAIPASGTNTSIVISCPALGLGNTNNAVVAYGYQL